MEQSLFFLNGAYYSLTKGLLMGAPENPYPAAVEDALTAYLWLLREGQEPKDIALVGDQVGGALVLTTLMQAMDAGQQTSLRRSYIIPLG